MLSILPYLYAAVKSQFKSLESPLFLSAFQSYADSAINKDISRVIAMADEGQSLILQVSDQFGYFTCLHQL